MLATNERIREAGVIQSQAVLTAIRDDWEGGARCSASTPRIIRGSRRQSVRYCPRAVGISHRLATKKAIRVKDLAGEAIILGTQDLMLRPRLDALFRSEGVEPNVPIETSLSYVACHLAEQGLGIAIVEPFTAHRFSGDRLAVRPFAADVSFSFGMLAPQNRPVSALTRTFADILDRQLRNLVLLNGIRPSIS
jgi:DNA-binding transcriptional LysR family regulator